MKNLLALCGNLAYSINPVFGKEMTERISSPTGKVVLSISGIWGCFSALFGVSGAAEMTLALMMLYVLFVTPGLAAESVIGERERRTLVSMQLSSLQPVDIVLGKLYASVAFVLLPLLAALPLLPVVYLTNKGRIGLIDYVGGLGLIMYATVSLAAISLFWSTFMPSVRSAILFSYGTILLTLTLFSPIFFMAFVMNIDIRNGKMHLGDTSLLNGSIILSALVFGIVVGPSVLLSARRLRLPARTKQRS